jgi:monothiol glutaredoxin
MEKVPVLDDATRGRIQSAIESHDVLLFMKGNPAQPQCGFSATVIQILNDIVPDYGTVDVLSDPEVRMGIKEFSNWPTIPQLYVKGEFVGGCDIIQEMYGSGELYETFGLPVPERVPPTFEVSDRATSFIRDALEQAQGQKLHLRIAANFEPRLYLGPEEPGELEAQAGGLSWFVDLPSGARADGIRIDYVETPQGHELPGWTTPTQRRPSRRLGSRS